MEMRSEAEGGDKRTRSAIFSDQWMILRSIHVLHTNLLLCNVVLLHGEEAREAASGSIRKQYLLEISTFKN